MKYQFLFSNFFLPSKMSLPPHILRQPFEVFYSSIRAYVKRDRYRRSPITAYYRTLYYKFGGTSWEFDNFAHNQASFRAAGAMFSEGYRAVTRNVNWPKPGLQELDILPPPNQPPCPTCPDSDSIIRLPVVFHILAKFEQTVDGKFLPMWLTPADVYTVIPIVNRIWYQARIKVQIKRVNFYKEPPTADQWTALSVLERASRHDEDPRPSHAALSTLSIRMGISDPRSLNFFFIPYIGRTRQGWGGDRTSVCGVWTNKPSRGRELPQKVALEESGLPWTISHELGHCLNLYHVKNPPPPVPTLMGSSPPGGGYGPRILTSNPNQVAIARMRAQELLRIFGS